ncbi:hypothetical protein RUM44_009064 [Polyplax serrata]|uniref:Uncharacterized protein n=1 Tax=Polyplax serrata TaxID=468196 RepID=A0ABR1ARM3_POLSC
MLEMQDVELARMVDFVKVVEPYLPGGLAAYLSGLGTFQDTNSAKHHLQPVLQPVKGHFGRITAENHMHYESLPAPYVYVERMLADLRPNVPPNLPLIRPEPVPQDQGAPEPGDDDGAAPPPQAAGPGGRAGGPVQGLRTPRTGRRNPGLPTVNLLGWYPKQVLSKNQTLFMQQYFGPDEIPINSDYLLYPSLRQQIRDRFSTLQRYTVTPVRATTHGSVAQQVVYKPDSLSPFSRRMYYSDFTGHTAYSSFVPSRIDSIARIMSYRDWKVNFHSGQSMRYPWACYDWGDYEFVPADWIANREKIFNLL